MAKAIIEGAIKGGVLDASAIAIADPDQSSRDYFEQLGCVTSETASQLPEASCELLAVKPQIFEEVARDFA